MPKAKTPRQSQSNTTSTPARKPVKKPARKHSACAKLTKRAYSLWTQYVKARDGQTCQLCGAHGGAIKPNGKKVILNAHHIIGRECRLLRFDVNNGLTLCQACHRFHPAGPHKGGVVFADWLRRTRPEVNEYLLKRQAEPCEAIESETGLQIIVEDLEDKINAMP